MIKVGDKVKVISADEDEVYGKKRHYFDIGQEVEVINILSDWYLECVGGGIIQYLGFDEVELVEQTSKKLIVGDLVKVIGNGDSKGSVKHNFPMDTAVTVVGDNGDNTFGVKYIGKLVIKDELETRDLYQVVEGRHLELIRRVK